MYIVQKSQQHCVDIGSHILNKNRAFSKDMGVNS